jgi:acyl-CoA thioesterase
MEDRKRGAYFDQVGREPFARLLDIHLRDVSEGYALCEMFYTESMDNIYGNAHGGAIFGLIDEAFEISSNSHDRVAVAHQHEHNLYETTQEGIAPSRGVEGNTQDEQDGFLLHNGKGR